MSMRGNDFIFGCVNFKCHKRNLKCGGLYIDINSPDRMKIKKAIINLINDDDRWFQQTGAVETISISC